jgi:hypothetical protein
MNRTYCRVAALAVAAICSILVLVSCTPDLTGTYVDETGAWRLELKSGGKATMSYGGQPGECTCTCADKKVTLTCSSPAGTATFDVQSDGSLAGPSNSMIPTLKKQK